MKETSAHPHQNPAWEVCRLSPLQLKLTELHPCMHPRSYNASHPGNSCLPVPVLTRHATTTSQVDHAMPVPALAWERTHVHCADHDAACLGSLAQIQLSGAILAIGLHQALLPCLSCRGLDERGLHLQSQQYTQHDWVNQ